MINTRRLATDFCLNFLSLSDKIGSLYSESFFKHFKLLTIRALSKIKREFITLQVLLNGPSTKIEHFNWFLSGGKPYYCADEQIKRLFKSIKTAC